MKELLLTERRNPMKKLLLMGLTHGVALVLGFAGGIYALPILTSPPSPTSDQLDSARAGASYAGEFTRDLKGSDLLHWGEGSITISEKAVSLMGRIAPGPDYRLYLSPVFVEDEAEFEQHKLRMVQVGEVRTFENFIVPLREGVDPARYNTVIVWCESFGEFITAARYREVAAR